MYLDGKTKKHIIRLLWIQSASIGAFLCYNISVKRKKIRKLSPLSALKRKAWTAFSLYIRNRDNWTCITCNKVDKSPAMHGGHFRHGDNMDFEEKNINAQCVSCNKWRHGALDVYAVKLDEKWGAGTAKDMYLLSKQYRGYRRADYEDVIAKYEV